MSLETKSHTINGFTYDIAQLGAKQGRIVLARVLRIVGVAAEAADPVAKLASALTDAEIEFLCDTFAKTTMFGQADTGNRVPLKDQFDLHFAGRYGDMIQWLWAALMVNYESFFSELGLSADKLQAAAKNVMAGNLANPTPPSGASSSTASAA